MGGSYKLTYYNSQGLAEPIRYLFALKGIVYEDIRLSEEDTFGIFLRPEYHQSPPYHRIPMLEFDDKRITQSTAILRFLGRKFNLCGKNDYEFSKCDQYLESTRDFLQYFTPAFLETDEKKRVEMFEGLNTYTNCYMSIINDFIVENGGTYLVGDSFTVADIYVVHVVTLIGQLFKCSKPIYADFPPLTNMCDKFFCIPEIQQWIQKRPC